MPLLILREEIKNPVIEESFYWPWESVGTEVVVETGRVGCPVYVVASDSSVFVVGIGVVNVSPDVVGVNVVVVVLVEEEVTGTGWEVGSGVRVVTAGVAVVFMSGPSAFPLSSKYYIMIFGITLSSYY